MNRKIALDKLRITATTGVVLLHTVTGVMDNTDMSGYPVERTLFLILLDWVTWCVPVFVLMSGYLFLNPDKKISFRRMLTKYCRRILLALFLFGVPYACMELMMTEFSFDISMVGQAVKLVYSGKSWAHMWYLYLILVLYFLTPFLKWALERIPRWSLYVFLGFLVLGSSILPKQIIVLPDGGIYLFYYLCGYLFAITDKKSRKKKKLTGIVIFWGLFVGMMFSRLLGDYSVKMAYNAPFTVAVSLLLMYFACGEPWARESVAITRISNLCFTIYLIHPVFLNVIYKLLQISLLDYPIWLSLPGIFLMVLMLSGIAAWVLYQIPLLRKYVL